jgi:hypothetical protein
VGVVHEEAHVTDPIARRRSGERREIGAHAHCSESGESPGGPAPNDDALRVDKVVRGVRDDLRSLNAVLDVDDAPLARKALNIRC